MARRFRAPDSYAEDTYSHRNFAIRYPHRKRVERVLGVIEELGPTTVLDYGAGDGHLFKALKEQLAHSPERLVAYEPVPEFARPFEEQVKAGQFGDGVEVVEEFEALRGQHFDLITCMGVLEHMPLLERSKFYGLCDEALGDRGRCLIDVPVEVGPALAIKHLGRTVIKGRPAEQTRRQLIRGTFGGIRYDPLRFDPDDPSTWISSHSGFDYRLFRTELEHRFDLLEQITTPFGALPPWLGNQEVLYLVAPRNELAPSV